MTFVEKLRKTKSHLKSSSVDTYLRNIKRLRKVFHELPIPDTENKWLVSKKLFSWFDKQKLSIRRHLATGAVVALKVYKKENEEWKKRSSKAMHEFDDDRRKRTLNDKQKKAMPSKGFDSLKIVVSNLKKEKHILDTKNTEWSLSDLVRVQELIIISLYYEYPLRLDYADLKTTKSEKENCIYKNLKKPRGYHIQLLEYKTSKSLGKRIFKLNAANQRLLNKFVPAVIRLTYHGFLLTNRSGRKMTKQVLSKTLMTITKKRIGKTFSVQLLRILFAMKNRDVLETAKEVSNKLLHSQEQSLQYAKKDVKKV